MSDETDLTPEDAFQQIYDSVNALFASHCDAQQGRSHMAYDTIGGKYYPFERVINGAVRVPGTRPRELVSYQAAADETATAIAAFFPDHVSQQIAWLDRPRMRDDGVFLRVAAVPADAVIGEPPELVEQAN